MLLSKLMNYIATYVFRYINNKFPVICSKLNPPMGKTLHGSIDPHGDHHHHHHHNRHHRARSVSPPHNRHHHHHHHHCQQGERSPSPPEVIRHKTTPPLPRLERHRRYRPRTPSPRESRQRCGLLWSLMLILFVLAAALLF